MSFLQPSPKSPNQSPRPIICPSSHYLTGISQDPLWYHFSHCDGDKLNSFNIQICPGDCGRKTLTVCNYSPFPQVSGEGTIVATLQLRKCNLAEGRSMAQEDEELVSCRGRSGSHRSATDLAARALSLTWSHLVGLLQMPRSVRSSGWK